MDTFRFNKNDVIYHDGENWECITADEEYAVFAQTYQLRDSGGVFTRINYENLFVVENLVDIDDGFECERL